MSELAPCSNMLQNRPPRHRVQTIQYKSNRRLARTHRAGATGWGYGTQLASACGWASRRLRRTACTSSRLRRRRRTSRARTPSKGRDPACPISPAFRAGLQHSVTPQKKARSERALHPRKSEIGARIGLFFEVETAGIRVVRVG